MDCHILVSLKWLSLFTVEPQWLSIGTCFLFGAQNFRFFHARDLTKEHLSFVLLLFKAIHSSYCIFVERKYFSKKYCIEDQKFKRVVNVPIVDPIRSSLKLVVLVRCSWSRLLTLISRQPSANETPKYQVRQHGGIF